MGIEDRTGVTPTEQVAQVESGTASADLEKYVDACSEMSDPRFMAFTDFADREFATELNRDPKLQPIMGTRLALISETIRQRTNGVKGYNREFKKVMKLGGTLKDAISTDQQKGQSRLGFTETMDLIKKNAIEGKFS